MTGLGLTLLLALGAALVLGAVAHRLRLSPMIGYIVAGLVVSRYTPGPVADPEQVLALADIGVALLMFSIGLQFSIRELVSLGRLVLLGAPIQVATTMTLGVVAGLMLGLPLLEALFIGAAVAVCSSVVLVKVAGEAALQTTGHGRIAIGMSLVQDLLTVALVVVLTSLSTQSDAPVLDALRSSGIAIGFVAIVVIGGSRVLPRLLAVVANLGSRELFVIAVAVVAIGTASVANQLGVSVALGAFVAGLALADSDLSASVLGEIVPLRELFATFFFVSIGILLDPTAVAEGLPIVAMLLLLITVGKAVPVALVGWLGGERPSVAIRAGGLLAQSGEFSFVLATAGVRVGAVTAETFSLAMGAVVISILLSGPIATLTGWLGSRLERVRALRQPLPGELEELRGLRRHAVIVGFGHVGRAVCRVLDSRGFRWVAIDVDYGRVRAARAAGAPVIFGDGGTPSVLDEARIADAHVLLLTVPDALAIRQAVGYAMRHNPRLEVVARAHSREEENALRAMGVARIVVAERELGDQLVRHALRRFGVSDREAAAVISGRAE
jgi:monovalent cation:H+ antiporter-2, CPA2 family